MLFNSLEFAAFLAVVLPLYYLLNKNWRRQNLLLVAAGYTFYGWWDARFLGLLILSTLADFTAGLVMESGSSQRIRKTAMILVVAFNLSLLGIFKYLNFFEASFAVVWSAVFGREPTWATMNLALPVGISFYTFQSIGYSLDVYRRQIPACRDLLSYSAFVAFFPQLVAGPIERAGHLLRQMTAPRIVTPQKVYLGICEFLWGLAKKLLVADYLAPHVDAVFSNLGGHRPASIVAATLTFAFQIYADFSAYSDMARGAARVLGFDLVQNFSTPYFATSLREFWQRWHMSLSGWFRDYVYIPLGGSRKGDLWTHLNTLAVFLLSGLWHGAAWPYVLWGGLHGAGLCTQRFLGGRRSGMIPLSPRFQGLAGWMMTFSLVCSGWYLFRAPSLPEAWKGITSMVACHDFPLRKESFNQSLLRISTLIVIDWVTRDRGAPMWLLSRKPAFQIGALATLLLAVAAFVTKKGTQFIYFQF
jgi:D-alanyl-lipoteichoic acid acyltransferase DltB (MBOAT superfamily)